MRRISQRAWERERLCASAHQIGLPKSGWGLECMFSKRSVWVALKLWVEIALDPSSAFGWPVWTIPWAITNPFSQCRAMALQELYLCSYNCKMFFCASKLPFNTENMPSKSTFPRKHLQFLLLLSHFSRVRLCVTPQTAAHQAPPPLGFSRKEHWSGLPFPSPMHESEEWKGSCSVVSDPQRPHGLQPTRLLRPWDFPGKSPTIPINEGHMATEAQICHQPSSLSQNPPQLVTCVMYHSLGLLIIPTVPNKANKELPGSISLKSGINVSNQDFFFCPGEKSCHVNF